MAKKDEQIEVLNVNETSTNAEQNSPSQTPNRDKMLANLRKKYGDDKSDEDLYGLAMDGYDSEHEFAKLQRADIDAFTSSIKDYPELALFYSEVARGNIGAAVLNLGDLLEAYRSGEIDDEGYKAKVAERKKAEEDAAAAEADKQAKIAKFDNEVFVPWCEKKGYDPEVWMNKANEMLFKPMIAYEMAEAQLDAIDNMINYAEYVEAARVQGRNENIVTQRKKSAAATDGQVNGGSASGAAGTGKESPLARMATKGAAARNL